MKGIIKFLPVFVLAFLMAWMKQDALVAAPVATITAVVIARLTEGIKFQECIEASVESVKNILIALFILMFAYAMASAFMTTGVGASVINLALKAGITAKSVAVVGIAVTAVLSVATGTSWGTMGTMGLALMGIAAGLGIPVGPTAGAILSGAYFGDKLSPLSDTTNLAPAMAGTDVFSHVKFMMKATITAYIIALVFFGVYGFMHASNGHADTSQLDILVNGIKDNFNVNPILLLPPLVVILAIALKMPAIPGITLGVIVAAIMAPIFQNGATLGAIFESAMNGYTMESGIKALDTLLTKGGLMGMAESILMTMIAMMFGGIMEATGQLNVIINAITKYVKSGPALIGVTELTCIASNVTMPEQYISILVPGRMYAPAYRKAGMHPVALSNALESAGTVTSPLVPWNTCAIYIKKTLGIQSTAVYFPWAIFNLAMPIVTFLFAFVGITIKKMTDEEQKIADEGGLVKL